MSKPRSNRVVVDGWVILDKPVGMTSTHAVSRLKRIFNAKKAGHAGTLDPLASGILPVAFGEATKTVPFVQDGEKAYRFTVRWGIETDSDDSDGKTVETSDLRPGVDQIVEMLPHFTGTIMQRPPAFSAIKIAGERAYDLARDGEIVEIEPRPVTINSLELVASTDDTATLEAQCGKGTYVRALARDMGRRLGTRGHAVGLRRLLVGPFGEEDMVPMDRLDELAETGEPAAPRGELLAVDTALAEIPEVVVNRDGAARLRRGQGVILRGRDAPTEAGAVAVTCGGDLVAIGEIEGAELRPVRVFNLEG